MSIQPPTISVGANCRGMDLHFPKELKGSASPCQLSICWGRVFLSGSALQRGSAKVSCRLHSFFARSNSQDGAEPSLLVYNPRPSLDTEHHIIAFKHSNQQAKIWTGGRAFVGLVFQSASLLRWSGWFSMRILRRGCVPLTDVLLRKRKISVGFQYACWFCWHAILFWG